MEFKHFLQTGLFEVFDLIPCDLQKKNVKDKQFMYNAYKLTQLQAKTYHKMYSI